MPIVPESRSNSWNSTTPNIKLTVSANIIQQRANITIFEVPQVQANKFSHNENILLKTIIKIL
jgi:hypothetical protein